MSTPTKELSKEERQVVAALAALRIARETSAHSPNADNLENEAACERMLVRCLDRLPRKAP